MTWSQAHCFSHLHLHKHGASLELQHHTTATETLKQRVHCDGLVVSRKFQVFGSQFAYCTEGEDSKGCMKSRI